MRRSINTLTSDDNAAFGRFFYTFFHSRQHYFIANCMNYQLSTKKFQPEIANISSLSTLSAWLNSPEIFNLLRPI